MVRRFLIGIMGVTLMVGAARAQEAPAARFDPAKMDAVKIPDIPGVVAGGTKLKLLATWEAKEGGEGPVGLPDGSVVFTKTGAHKLAKIDPDGKVSDYVLLGEKNTVFGLAYDSKGRVIGTQRGEPWGLVAYTPTRTVLADKCDGKPFGRPNDLVVDGKGGVYFTDNTGPRGNTPAPAGVIGPGVYHVSADGKVIQVTNAIGQPNGVQLSPDGKVLYVGMGQIDYVKALDIKPDGTAGPPRDFAKVAEPGKSSGADGMGMDAAGHLYVATNEGIQVFSPKGGNPIGIIPTPGKPMNLTFAGKDKKTLVIIMNGGAALSLPMRAQAPKGRAK